MIPRAIAGIRNLLILAMTSGLLPMASGSTNTVLTTVQYKVADNEPLRLDVCVPAPTIRVATNQLRPVVIVIHGGGWSGGDRKTDIRPILETLTAGEYIYVSMDYRLSPKYHWPAFCEDVDDAVAWTKAHVAEYGGDPDRIGILGYSAGGQLAFRAAALDKPPHRLKALIGVAPATDFLEDIGRRGGLSEAMREVMGFPDDEPLDKELQQLYQRSPINQLHDGMPPILILQGTADRTVTLQQSLNIQWKIHDQHWKIPCEIYEVQGAPHRQSEWDRHDPGYRKKLLDWLGAHL